MEDEKESTAAEDVSAAAPEDAAVTSEEKVEESQQSSSSSGPGEATMEDIKLVADDISASVQSATEDVTDKEEAHKVLNPLAAKLAIAKAKFAALVEKQRGKSKKADDDKDEGDVNEEGTTIEVTQNSQHGETVAFEETTEAQTPKREDKKEEMKHKAEEAAKKALDSAEKIAKEAGEVRRFLPPQGRKEGRK